MPSFIHTPRTARTGLAVGVMAKKIKQKNGDIVYKCEECGLKYPKEKDALGCESWCKEYKVCNLEITDRAIRED
ncbi:MAG: hypothetical protein HYS73_00165 [Parcubacteria group bacterium]|nr:hypothetical protein [Parcubacteria group bacterium]